MSVDLDAAELTVRFGGLTAVDNVSLSAPGGAITGLIGPNGAGKTTIFNAMTGVVRPTRGSVRLGGQTLDHLTPTARAQRGLGRTFQRMELFDTMTVAQNVALGPELHFAGRRVWRHLVSGPRERAESLARAADAIDRCGLASIADQPVADLSTGQRRLVEIARAISTQFRFLLLDEPSSGLDVHETEEFADILTGIVAREGTGILLVEHDMALVRSVCSYIYVLDFGRLIYKGETRDVLASELVKAAYLGSEAVEEIA